MSEAIVIKPSNEPEKSKNIDIISERERMPELIPELTKEEKEHLVEYSHIMLKPEAMATRGSSPELWKAFITAIMEMCEDQNLEVVAFFAARIPRSIVNEIYKKEIDKNIIPEDELARFVDSMTGHIILKGAQATVITAGIKGRFVCRDDEICFRKFAKEFNLSNQCIDPSGSETIHEISDGRWGGGCGIRGMLARMGLVLPDPGESDYTIYNWIHAPDPKETRSVSAVINMYNTSKDNISSPY